ncbi:reverse transcriptase domain-containing protein [Tanacetum coccineum]
MKLNLKKCSFDVKEGPFLGHLITKQGIKANPLKIKAVTELEQPRALKDIQSLNGKLAALSHFLSKGAERSLPFFNMIESCKGKKKIHWTDEVDKAFKEMKNFIQSLPTLTAPRAGETLIVYLAASKDSINAALFTKRNEGQIPIYFVSRVLQGAKLNYPALEKLILALVHASRRLRRYFQAHTIMVLTCEHDIVFLKRYERETPVDFLLDIPFDDRAGLMLIDPAGKEYTYALRFEFETTNNEAEYEALLAGLRIAQEMEITKVAIFLDSQLVVNQIKGTYAAKQLSIKSYLQKVKTALKGFEGYTVEHVRRNQNKKADALSKLASMTFEHLTKEVLVEVLAKRSIEEKEVLKEAAKTIQDYDKCKEQSAIRKAGVDRAIAVGSTWPFSHWGIQVLGPLPMAPGDFYKGLKITHSFSPITEHMEIMHYIEKQLVQSQQSWVDNLAKELWVHKTLPRNSQEETPFSLTYISEAVVPTAEATNDRGRKQETTKKGKEIDSIEKAHYRNKLQKYHNTRNNYSNYIMGDFVLFLTSSQEQQGPHMISEVHKDGFYTLVNVADDSLIQKAKGTSLRKLYM